MIYYDRTVQLTLMTLINTNKIVSIKIQRLKLILKYWIAFFWKRKYR